MFNISKFLNKFVKEIDDNINNKEVISDKLNSIIGVKIQPSSIYIKDYVVFVKSNPSVLNKIFINKNKIITELSKIDNIKIIDIR